MASIGRPLTNKVRTCMRRELVNGRDLLFFVTTHHKSLKLILKRIEKSFLGSELLSRIGDSSWKGERGCSERLIYQIILFHWVIGKCGSEYVQEGWLAGEIA